MNLKSWLEAEKGRSAALAEHFSKTPAAISQWKTNGVPVALMRAVRDFTGGEVTLEDMVPERPALPDAAQERIETKAAA